MNYNLTLDNKENIDLSKITLNKKESFDLSYIDNITMQCEDEFALKKYLLTKNLISKDDLEKEISISYGKTDKRNIPILYETEKEEVDNLYALAIEIKNYFNQQKRETYCELNYTTIMGDYDNITSYFESFQVLAKNHKFLRCLQEYASGNPKLGTSINDISRYIKQFSGDSKSRVIYIALFDIFRYLFYRLNKDTKELEFNYRSFRDFCVFYCDYKRNVKLKKNIKLTKDKTNNTNTEDSDDFIEPDFPPNSEEEKSYLRYLEELSNEEYDIENHDHYRR